MITNLIVCSALLFGVAFFIAWWLRPDLRAWIERPKYNFQANVKDYDRKRRQHGSEREGSVKG